MYIYKYIYIYIYVYIYTYIYIYINFILKLLNELIKTIDIRKLGHASKIQKWVETQPTVRCHFHIYKCLALWSKIATCSGLA